MIEAISIRNLGVIQQAQLSLGPGFTALTGETGAGKTMVLTALDLVLGGRADTSAIRKGESLLFVEGIWQIEDPKLTEKLQELGADTSNSELIINRSVTAEGRSRAVVSGATVPVGVLAEIAQSLVAVHGQSEQLRLRSAAAQRQALDAFGGANLKTALDSYHLLFAQYQETKRRIERLENSTSADQRRLTELKEFLSDLEKLDPVPDEEQEISERILKLSNVEALRQVALAAHEALSSEGEFDAVGLIGVARRSLDSGASQDAVLGEYAQELTSALETAREVATKLASYLNDLEADPNQLEQLMQRKAAISAFCKKHQGQLNELLERKPAALAESLDLESGDEQLEKLEQQFAALESQLSHAANTLTQQRQAAANSMTERVNQELAALAMAGSTLVVKVEPIADFEANGLDKIEFLLAAHPGAEPRPLGKGASGGELSRIMLAIELVLAGNDPLPTLIFDEVDAGVGGAAAVELGKRLKKLSESTQVIVVTHLPQVAAFADTQLRVQKNSAGEFTASSVEVLEFDARIAELARMLSGNESSEVALAHARELLANR